MGLKDIINKYFSVHVETSESHVNGELKTHYYKAMKDKAFNELLTIFNQSPNYDVTSTSIDRGELIVSGTAKKKVFIVATVIMVRPNRTAIDFAVTTETLLPTDFGYSSKVIKELYNKLDEQLEYVGSGIGAQLT